MAPEWECVVLEEAADCSLWTLLILCPCPDFGPHQGVC